ncbi:hypothetical protein EF294_14595 [Gordonia oryzae]|uniref:Uncharacterized protein n=1 Tax=Gordonia oryzae TaxID=2487349 RepID=A0A3N4G9W1_9ACTN|nr:hypothetical protein [Gordonia oryzae]RPA59045.1 hypothetical protein EF294_14595 [Gordonia oryzae]
MDSEGCWSTVVSTAAERRALGLPESAGWMLECRLPIGHRSNHATDGSTSPRTDRRVWLEWSDFAPHAQSLIERNPCPLRSLENAGCLYFHGHPGPHLYARSNGHAPTAMSGMAAGGHGPAVQYSSAPGYSTQGTAPGPSGSHGPSTGDLPVAGAGVRGSHRMPEPPRPELSRPEPFGPEPSSSAPPIVGESDYRGGRRSTDSAPPHDQTHGRRHSVDVPASRPEPTLAPDQPDVAAVAAGPTPAESAAQESAHAHDTHPALGLTEVGDALDDVARALVRLAAALRRD